MDPGTISLIATGAYLTLLMAAGWLALPIVISVGAKLGISLLFLSFLIGGGTGMLLKKTYRAYLERQPPQKRIKKITDEIDKLDKILKEKKEKKKKLKQLVHLNVN